jgi:hypothetical protein
MSPRLLRLVTLFALAAVVLGGACGGNDDPDPGADEPSRTSAEARATLEDLSVKPVIEKPTGWDKGIVGMREGGRRELTIPPELAYGSEGAPPDIAPNETLVFVVDLVRIR